MARSLNGPNRDALYIAIGLGVVLALLTVVLVVASNRKKSASPAVTAEAPPPTTQDVVQRDAAVGFWYGQAKHKGGGGREWIARYESDGKLKIRFRVTEQDGTQFDAAHFGYWGVTGSYFVTYVTSGEKDGKWVEWSGQEATWVVYRLQEISADQLRFTNEASGNQFVNQRVTADFDFPKR